MDERLRTRLDRLAPEPRETLGWDDVLRRAGRIRRRRRRRAALVAVAALLLVSAGALGAAGRLAGLLSHTREPHLVVRGDLRAGTRHVGSIEIELSRAAVVLDGHARLLPWRPPGSSGGVFPARWFLERGGERASRLQGALYLGRPARRLLVLCRDCAGRDSGRLDLSYEQASELVDDRVVFTLGQASARLVLDRARLHRALRCIRAAQTTRCTRFYTGR
jgi:hypothetical protein